MVFLNFTTRLMPHWHKDENADGNGGPNLNHNEPRISVGPLIGWMVNTNSPNPQGLGIVWKISSKIHRKEAVDFRKPMDLGVPNVATYLEGSYTRRSVCLQSARNTIPVDPISPMKVWVFFLSLLMI